MSLNFNVEMASITGDEDQERKLSEIFDDNLKSYEEIEESVESSSSDKYQTKLKELIASLEDLSRMVSQVGMFSSNEDFEEVATSDIKYLLLPCLLGNLTVKLVGGDRQDLLNSAEVYYKNFLTLCRSYGLTNYEITTDDIEDNGLVEEKPLNVEEMARKREDKISAFKEKKEQEEMLKELKRQLYLGEGVDEELQRKYYVGLIKNFISKTMEEHKTIKTEKSILIMMKKMKGQIPREETLPENSRQRFKPVIITRNEYQKKVYGLGYPSVATMTVEEFYEQRLKNPNQPTMNSNSLMDKALSGFDREAEREADLIQKEIELEKDDVDALIKIRAWDDWKDDNRRGSGNRKNMG